jgi:ribonuclease HI
MCDRDHRAVLERAGDRGPRCRAGQLPEIKLLMSFDPHALKIYIDGSCFNNPGGNGGFAAIVEYPDDHNRDNEQLEEVGFHETTNQRMELRACIWAHRWANENGASLKVNRAQIVIDSQYVHNFWRTASYWKRNGWRLTDGRPAENHDLWKELLSIRSKLRVRIDIEWIKGKKSEITKAVDKAAKRAAKQPSETDRGFRPGKVGRTRIKVAGTASLFPAAGQEADVLVYQTGAYSRAGGENKVKFQVFSKPKNDFDGKYVAYATPEIGSLLHRGRVYHVQFNTDPKYPRIIEVTMEFSTASEYLNTKSNVVSIDSKLSNKT